ncbi:hypothetical protein NG726_21520 [Pseudomonas sp. MOB-449]|nr:hypothetical protein [Pseudomonas sp. MOB-449]
MRQFLFACLVVVLVAGAIQSIKASMPATLADSRAGLPVASIGDVFSRF